jgi:hypothetical protein
LFNLLYIRNTDLAENTPAYSTGCLESILAERKVDYTREIDRTDVDAAADLKADGYNCCMNAVGMVVTDHIRLESDSFDHTVGYFLKVIS